MTGVKDDRNMMRLTNGFAFVRMAFLALVAVSLPLAEVRAQRISAGYISQSSPFDGRRFNRPASQSEKNSSRTELMILSGLGFGTIGFISGILIADGRTANMSTIFISGLVGEAILLPLGVHLANGRRGSNVQATIGSGFLVVLATIAANASNTPYPFFAMPVAQLYSGDA